MTFNKSNVIVSGSRSSLNEYANYTTVFPKPVMVGDKIVLTQDMINKQNVKYIIKWNFDLNDETLTVPEGCLIEFDGGSFSNGTLVGNETILDGTIKLSGIKFSGTFDNTIVNITNDWGTTPDFFGIIQCFSRAKINLYKDIIVTSLDNRVLQTIDLNGNGHTIKVKWLGFSSTANITIKNCIFDCSDVERNTSSDDGTIQIVGNANNKVIIENCDFIDCTKEFGICLRNVKDATVNNCNVYGDLTSSSTRREENTGNAAIFFFNCSGNIVAKNNVIKNFNGYGIRFLPRMSDNNTNIRIEGNLVDTVAKGGIGSSGGIVYNIIISDNIIKNTTYLGQVYGDEDAINVHGFYNMQIINNVIDSPYGVPVGISGYNGDSAVKNDRGINGLIANNNITSYFQFQIWHCKNITIENNDFHLRRNDDIQSSYSGKLNNSTGSVLMLSEDAKIVNNTFTIKDVSFVEFADVADGGYSPSYLISDNTINIEIENYENNIYYLFGRYLINTGITRKLVLDNNKYVIEADIEVRNLFGSKFDIKYLHTESRRVIINPSKSESTPIVYNKEAKHILEVNYVCKNTSGINLGSDLALENGRIDRDGSYVTPYQWYGKVTIPQNLYFGHRLITDSISGDYGYCIVTDGTGPDVDIELEFVLTDYPLYI